MTKMQHPPFKAGDGKAPLVDYCNKDGAHMIAARIRAAWARIGVPVETEVVEVSRGRDGHPLYAVRMPGLVNGLPVAAPAGEP